MKKSPRTKLLLQITLLLAITVFAVINCDLLRQALMRFAVEKNNLATCQICLKLGEKVNTNIFRSFRGYGYDDDYLIRAARYQSTDVMRLLIQHGASLSSKDASGKTPLHISVMQENLPAVQLLLESGAPLDICDNDAQTPLSIAEAVGNLFILDAIRKQEGKLPGAPIRAIAHEPQIYPSINYSNPELSKTSFYATKAPYR